MMGVCIENGTGNYFSVLVYVCQFAAVGFKYSNYMSMNSCKCPKLYLTKCIYDHARLGFGALISKLEACILWLRSCDQLSMRILKAVVACYFLCSMYNIYFFILSVNQVLLL